MWCYKGKQLSPQHTLLSVHVKDSSVRTWHFCGSEQTHCTVFGGILLIKFLHKCRVLSIQKWHSALLNNPWWQDVFLLYLNDNEKVNTTFRKVYLIIWTELEIFSMFLWHGEGLCWMYLCSDLQHAVPHCSSPWWNMRNILCFRSLPLDKYYTVSTIALSIRN
jgi:hypothetical protein